MITGNWRSIADVIDWFDNKIDTYVQWQRSQYFYILQVYVKIDQLGLRPAVNFASNMHQWWLQYIAVANTRKAPHYFIMCSL